MDGTNRLAARPAVCWPELQRPLTCDRDVWCKRHTRPGPRRAGNAPLRAGAADPWPGRALGALGP
eukprot:378610-Lingulodinium_polyedra.AAC.1